MDILAQFISGLSSLELGIWSFSDFRKAYVLCRFQDSCNDSNMPLALFKNIYRISSLNIMQRLEARPRVQGQSLCESGMCPRKPRRQVGRQNSAPRRPRPAPGARLSAQLSAALGLGLRWEHTASAPSRLRGMHRARSLRLSRGGWGGDPEGAVTCAR